MCLALTFTEGACDKLTKTVRTFEMFSPSTLSTHCLYTWKFSLFYVNLYADLFFSASFTFYPMLYGLTFVFSIFLIRIFSMAFIIYSMKRYPNFLSLNLFICILKVTSENFKPTSFHLSVQDIVVECCLNVHSYLDTCFWDYFCRIQLQSSPSSGCYCR